MNTSKGKWSKSVVLITGASSGIGAALARQVAQEGARVVLTARRTERLDQLSTELNQMGVETLAIPCDVTDRASVDACIGRVIQDWGRLDVVVANAGFGVSGSFNRLTADDFHRQFDTNIFGVIHILKAAAPHLEASQGRAAIIGSVNGHISLANGAPYGMSKFAVRALAQSLWFEWSRLGISVTLIEPGFVDSEIRKIDNQGQLKETARDPIPRWLMMSAEKAARQISRAISRRKREVVITGHGKFVVWLVRHFPILAHQIAKKVRVR